jgi:hypothetical protein
MKKKPKVKSLTNNISVPIPSFQWKYHVLALLTNQG